MDELSAKIEAEARGRSRLHRLADWENIHFGYDHTQNGYAPYLGQKSPQFIEVIRPALHHQFSFWKVFGMIVDGANVVAFAVGELPFDGIGAPPLFV